jgi:hypothetical protein
MIALASLRARRLGPAASGWLIDPPMIARPVGLLVARDHSTTHTSRIGLSARDSARGPFVLGSPRLAVGLTLSSRLNPLRTAQRTTVMPA